MTGDVMARTAEEYKPFYDGARKAMDDIFATCTAADPKLIADLVLEAVAAENPRAACTAGPLSGEFIGKRTQLDDDGFLDFMLKRFGLV